MLQILELLLPEAQPDLLDVRLAQAFILVDLLTVQWLCVDGEVFALDDYSLFPVGVLLRL